MRFVNTIRSIINALVVVIFILLILTVFGQICARAAHMPLRWADEFARFCFVWLVYLGITIAVRKGMNITFDVLLDAWKGRTWKVMFTIVNMIVVAFAVLCVVLGAQLCISNLAQSSPLMGVNMGLVMSAIPLGSFLMLFEQVFFYMDKIRQERVD